MRVPTEILPHTDLDKDGSFPLLLAKVIFIIQQGEVKLSTAKIAGRESASQLHQTHRVG